MKKTIKNISVGCLAIIVLLSSFSFTINNTYCKGNLINTSIFNEISCCNDNDTDAKTVSHDCCSFEKLIVKGQTELQVSQTISYDFEKQISFFIHQPFNLEHSYLFSDFIPIDTYTPPPLIIEPLTLYQVFLI